MMKVSKKVKNAIILGLGLGGVLLFSECAPFVVRFPVDISKSEDYYYSPLTRSVYYSPRGNYLMLDYRKVPDATASNFKILGDDWAISDVNLYYRGYEVQINPNNYTKSRHFVWDDNTVYWFDSYDHVQMKDVDATSFRPLAENSQFAKDRNRLYFAWRPIQEKLDAEKFIDFSIDNNLPLPVGLYESTLFFPNYDSISTHLFAVEKYSYAEFKKVPVSDLKNLRITEDKLISFDNMILTLHGDEINIKNSDK